MTYIAELYWLTKEEGGLLNIPERTEFPLCSAIIDNPFKEYKSDVHWSVLIQNIELIDERRTKSYFRYIACENVPNETYVGMNVVIRRGGVIAQGKIIGRITDPEVHNKLIQWNPHLPKLERNKNGTVKLVFNNK